ncbi:hypothetical protein J3F84DRAFT_380161 [Trichoderma pleuroticola]
MPLTTSDMCIVRQITPYKTQTYILSSQQRRPSSTPSGGQTCLPNNLFDTCHGF